MFHHIKLGNSSYLNRYVHNICIIRTSRTTKLTDSNRIYGFTRQAVTIKVAEYFEFGVNVAVGL